MNVNEEERQNLQKLLNNLLNSGQTQYNKGDYQSAIASHISYTDCKNCAKKANANVFIRPKLANW